MQLCEHAARSELEHLAINKCPSGLDFRRISAIENYYERITPLQITVIQNIGRGMMT
jgi:hypothetical protein